MALRFASGLGIGNLREVSAPALRVLANLTEQAEEKLGEGGMLLSIGQNTDGSLFLTATTFNQDFAVLWAFIDQDGDRLFTAYCEESAIREACRIGPWDIHTFLEKLGEDADDLRCEELTNA